ncbi:MAG: beta-galactosidase [Kiritimatiellae bacterium]|nr:beta-galactosidase [Kiritimatiellia bacterium]
MSPRWRRRSPYLAFDCACTNAVDEYVDLLPEKTYAVSVVGAAAAGIKFSDQDGRPIDRIQVANGGSFIVPAQTMRARLEARFASTGSLRIEQVADAPQDFNWKDWNAWAMKANFAGPAVFRRRFVLNRLPEYAFLRVWRESVLINGQELGKSVGSYVNDNYFNIQPRLRIGENTIEISSTDSVASNAFAKLNADIQFRHADGSYEVILGSDGKWEARPLNGGDWTAVTEVAPSWYNKTLFDRPWVAPAELPHALFSRRWDVDAKISLVRVVVRDGEPVRGRVELNFKSLPYFTSNRFKIELVTADGEVVWYQWVFPEADLRSAKVGTRVSAPFELSTRYVKPGRYALRLDGRLSAGKMDGLAEVVVGPSASKPVKAEFVVDKAVDLVRIDGREMPMAALYSAPYYSATIPRGVEDDIYQFSRSGYRIFSLKVFFGIDTVKGSGPSDALVWKGPGQYDFSQLDEYARQILSVCPDAYIILNVNADVPDWWRKSHPGESVVLDDGTRFDFTSYASTLWQNETAKAMRDMTAHVRNSFWGDRVALFFLVAGYDGQWFQPTERRPPYRYSDYSPQQRDHFRAWLQREYKTPERLSAAWGRHIASFETVEIPSRKERVENRPYYLDPVGDRPSIDFLRSVAALTDEVIGKFMNAISEGLGRPVPGGTYHIPSECTYFYGQVQRPCEEGIYDCKAYSFAASPLGYDCHGLSQGGTGLNGYSRLQRLSGRLFVGEDDTRTFRSQPYNPRWGNPTAFGTLAGFRRNIAQRLTSGGAHWFLDIHGHWFDSPSIQRAIRREHGLMALLGEYLPLRSLGADIAQVRKIGTNLHKRINTQEDLGQVHFPRKSQTKPHFAMDTLVWRNLEEHTPGELGYRVYLFDDLYALGEADLRTLDRFKSNGNVLVFTHATGYSNMRTLSAENVSKAVGIEVADDRPGQVFSDMTWSWTADGSDRPQRGPKAKRFNVVDGNATVLGRYADGRVAAAMKHHGDWTSVYLPAAYPQGEVLECVGRTCGLRICTDLPVNVGSGGRCISVYCPVESAVGAIRLPGRFSAVELYSGKCHFATEEIPVDMAYGDTRLFFIGDAEEVRSVARRAREIVEVGLEK